MSPRYVSKITYKTVILILHGYTTTHLCYNRCPMVTRVVSVMEMGKSGRSSSSCLRFVIICSIL